MDYFKTFYKTKKVDSKEIQEYLNKFKLQPISEKIKKELNKQVMEDEISNAIKVMKHRALMDFRLCSIKNLKKNFAKY